LQIAELADGLRRIEISGELENIARLAKMVDLPLIRDMAAQLIDGIVPVPLQLENAQCEERPFNWEAEYFDLTRRSWLKGLQPNSACRFTPHSGPSKFLLHRRRCRFLQMPKREAVYASAMLQSVNLLSYEPSTAVLTVPAATPLPERLARIACLCTGTQPRLVASSLKYEAVPYEVAFAILVAVGQPLPRMQPIIQMKRNSVG
jgi:hypothetical protein